MKKQIKNALPVVQNQSLVSARGVNDDTSLDQYIQNVRKIPMLTASEEYEYAKRWTETGDMAAAEKLVASHLNMVVSVAHKFRQYGIPLGELIASGNMGLMQAVQKFDPDKGFRFSTYAMFWIKAEMYDTILNNWSLVKIGTSANQKRVFFNLARARRALGISGNTLTDKQTQEIADYLNVPENDVRRMSTRMSARDVSLNAPQRSDDNAQDILSNMPDEKSNLESDIEQMEFRRRGYELLRKNLEKLPERDREILRARRLSDPVATLESLSQKYGISRERVRQIEERAYKKLRDAVLHDAGENKSPLLTKD